MEDIRKLKYEKDIDHYFCKKYSRIKMDDTIWKRIDFDKYKRSTKDERIKSIKEQISPKRKLSKKKQKKLCDKLYKEAKIFEENR